MADSQQLTKSIQLLTKSIRLLTTRIQSLTARRGWSSSDPPIAHLVAAPA